MTDRPGAAGFTVFGGFGHALAIADHLQSPSYRATLGAFVGLIVDDPEAVTTAADGILILSFARWVETYRHLPTFVGEADPDRRRAIVARIAAAGGCFISAFAARPRPYVSIGAGSVVGDHVYIGRLTTIGDHVQVSNCISIGHDVEIGAYTTVGPACTISGHVEIEPGCMLGAGATIAPGRADRPLRIGRGATIAPGAVIIRSVPAGAHMTGNPARSVAEAEPSPALEIAS